MKERGKRNYDGEGKSYFRREALEKGEGDERERERDQVQRNEKIIYKIN